MATKTTADLVGQRVRDRLKAGGLTQSDLGRHLDLSQVAVSTRLRGVVAFNIDELARTAALLGCSVSDLVSGGDDDE